MKNKTQKLRTFAMLVFLALATMSMAHSGSSSSLRLNLPTTTNHIVTIDNVVYHVANNRFKLDGMQAGNHRIKVVEVRYNNRGQHRRVLLFQGNLFVPRNAKVMASINRYGHLVINRTAPNNSGNQRARGQNRQYNSRSQGYNNRRDGDGNSHRNAGINSVYSSIKEQSFDSEKLKIAKNAAQNNEITSEESSEIMKLFSFESTRLDFAKFSYQYVSDPENFHLVNKSFQFSTSISELQDYISQKGDN